MRTGPDSTASRADTSRADPRPTDTGPADPGPADTGPAGDGRPGSTLAPLDEGILAFERRRWRSHSAKDEAIRTTFGLAPASYYVRLSRLVESDEAMAYDPLLVQRLQRRVAGAG